MRPLTVFQLIAYNIQINSVDVNFWHIFLKNSFISNYVMIKRSNKKIIQKKLYCAKMSGLTNILLNNDNDKITIN